MGAVSGMLIAVVGVRDVLHHLAAGEVEGGRSSAGTRDDVTEGRVQEKAGPLVEPGVGDSDNFARSVDAEVVERCEGIFGALENP